MAFSLDVCYRQVNLTPSQATWIWYICVFRSTKVWGRRRTLIDWSGFRLTSNVKAFLRYSTEWPHCRWFAHRFCINENSYSSFTPDFSIICIFIFSSVLQQLVFNSVTNCLGPRKFLHSGKLFKAKSSKELYGFLFNDFLLLTQVRLTFLLVLIPMSCSAILNICDFSQVTKPLGSSGLDKVFSSKTHLQYRMYKTVSTQPLLHYRQGTCLYISVHLASRSQSSSTRC